MSWFATISALRSVQHIPGVSIVPIEIAQEYLHALAPDISRLDGSPVYYCDDGTSGTSTDFIVPAEDQALEEGSIEGSTTGIAPAM